jgi:ribosomal protein S9
MWTESEQGKGSRLLGNGQHPRWCTRVQIVIRLPGGIDMAEIEMPHEDHEKHLCLLKNVGYVKRHLEEYKALVRDPRYVCRKCGRAAARKKNLCKPDAF